MAGNEVDRVGIAEPYKNASSDLEEEKGSIDLVALFQTLHRGRRTVLRSTLVVFVLAIVIAFLLPVQYTSTVSFIPPNLSNSSSMSSLIAGQLSAMADGLLVVPRVCPALPVSHHPRHRGDDGP